MAELTDIKATLETKVSKIDTESEKIAGFGEEIDLLYKKIPDGAMLEEYLKILVLDAAESGFVVQRFRQEPGAGEGITLEIELTGSLGAVPDLVKAIESAERFAEVKGVGTTTREDGATDVKITVVVYSMRGL